MFDLTGKTALVTGSTQGIGFAAAQCLASRGAQVIINGASSLEKCERAAAAIGDRARVALQDLQDHDCAEKLRERG